MHPANFAIVMATGIVSIACHLVGLRTLARWLLVLNLGLGPLLWALFFVRLARYPANVLADVMHHSRSVGYFTAVAATCVLGSQCVLVGGYDRIALWLWAAGIALWAICTYGIFVLLTIKKQKPALAEGLHGGWLLAVVAAQSVATLGAQVAPLLGTGAPVALFFSLAMWLGGGMLYIWIIGLIFYRYTFLLMSPSDLAPPYWINMGASAITTLAGAMLAMNAELSPVLQQLAPFVRGLTLLWWATATWWIPMLVGLGAWRHLYRKFPLRYDALYWGAVFPLGMYTACTVRLAAVLDAPFLLRIPQYFIYSAIVAWCATMAGLIVRLGSMARRYVSREG